MKRFAALVLVLTMVMLATKIGGEPHRFATMALGFLLIVAALFGEAGEGVHIPRVTGYLLVGLAFGPSVMNVITASMTSQLRLINGLAVALIAFSAGMELDLPGLKSQAKSLTRHGGVLILILFVGLFAAAIGVSPWLDITAGENWTMRIAITLVLAAVMATFSPTVTMAVLAETRAKGPLAARVLALVVIGDLAVVLIFTVATTVAKLLSGASADLGAAAGHMTWELIGSPLVGVATGLGIYAYRRFVNRKSGLVVAAACLILAEIGGRMGLSALLSCLTAGLIVRNLAPQAAHEMEELIDRVRLPVLVIFFAAAGASLHLADLKTLWPVVVGLVLVRGALVVAGNKAGVKAAAFDPLVGRHVPLGLFSQAGVTIGLAVIVGRDFGAWGQSLETLFVATISMHEIIGPVAFRYGLGKLGEIPSEAEIAAAEAALAEANLESA